jgi:FdhE protein
MLSTGVRKLRDWDRRIHRAVYLGERYPAAAAVIAFYQTIAELQKHIFDHISPRDFANHPPEASLRNMISPETVADQLPALFSIVDRTGTPLLQNAADELRNCSTEETLSLISRFANEVESAEDPRLFFVRVCMQPFAERIASERKVAPGFGGSVCPLCSGKPQLAVLRPEGDGGKRSLICCFCITEWEFRRVLCPICGEADYQKLPRYSADGIPAIRVEACESCGYYLKSVDMTTEGLAEPVVDEIATLSLDLWAREHSYQKISRNIMGF